jgi:hypothetical protein
VAYVGNTPLDGAPILELRIIDLATKHVTVPGVRVLTDWNGPQWLSNSTLLINRYD